jgi:hypothetical protein
MSLNSVDLPLAKFTKKKEKEKKEHLIYLASGKKNE